jgi:hypothetical protein
MVMMMMIGHECKYGTVWVGGSRRREEKVKSTER